jgi:hypothetical protein
VKDSAGLSANPPAESVSLKQELTQMLPFASDPARALATASEELHQAVGELETVLAGGDGPVRLDSDGDLVISPLSAEDVGLL